MSSAGRLEQRRVDCNKSKKKKKDKNKNTLCLGHWFFLGKARSNRRDIVGMIYVSTTHKR